MTTQTERTTPFTQNLILLSQLLGTSLLIALISQVRIPLPFTPVPVTLQTLAVMMAGMTLGSRKGALAVLFYLAQVSCGLPVLNGGNANAFALLGPTGGYLIGFVAQAFLVGYVSERMQTFQPVKLFLGCLLACAVQLALGSLQLASFVGWEMVFWMGVYPFLLGEVCKIFLACGYKKCLTMKTGS